MNTDKLTTIIGAIMAAAVAVKPITTAVSGPLQTSDYIHIILAVALALQGYFTNKGGTADAQSPLN